MDPEQVHALRTGTRRAEAILGVLSTTGNGPSRRFRKALKRVRRCAGTVRDWDVQLGFLRKFSTAENSEPLTGLIKTVSRKRSRAAQELHRTLDKEDEPLIAGLKAMEHTLGPESSPALQKSWSTKAASLAVERRHTLATWPRLNERTLHDFRIHVKDLRDTLLLGLSVRSRQMQQVTAIKDSLGEWHDWSVLSALAQKDKQMAALPFARRIAAVEKAKCAAALQQALAFRKFLRKSLTTAARRVSSTG